MTAFIPHFMTEPLADLISAQRLIETGQFGAAVDLMSRHQSEESVASPTRALLFAVAHARLGHHSDGRRWAETARRQASVVRDRQVAARALNILGAIAFEEGSIEEALHYLDCALAEGYREADQGTVGRCSNNIGVIANIRGDHAKAVAAYTIALGAYERAGCPRGIAEVHHNLAMTYRDTGEIVRALESAGRAVKLAEHVGDRSLLAQTRTCRGELRILAGDVALGRREVEWALTTQRAVGNELGECEALRVLALAMIQDGQWEDAEAALRRVIRQAEHLSRPLLAAEAGRDLAYLLDRCGARTDWQDVVTTAHARFVKLGAALEQRKMGKLMETAANDG
jgi:tetratricopeptide (TPR) repeat protein